MRLVRGSYNWLTSYASQGCVATIGNFDGIHRGHQAVIQALQQKAAALNLPTVLISFSPHPKEFFAKEPAPARLTRLRDKYLLLAAQGIDYFLCLPFNQSLATAAPQDFIQDLLVDRLHIRHLIVGEDFRFGFKRQGDYHLLQQQGLIHNFAVETLPVILHHQQRISSSWIRAALQVGDLNLAASLLGRPYTLSGRVAHGDKRGRTIGFPTANIHLLGKTAPLLGVYAVRIQGLDKIYEGVANIGHRPTLGGTRDQLEVHIFDFAEEIYGCHLTIEFKEKIRDEKKFANFEELKQQIAADAHYAKQLLRMPA